MRCAAAASNDGADWSMLRELVEHTKLSLGHKAEVLLVRVWVAKLTLVLHRSTYAELDSTSSQMVHDNVTQLPTVNIENERTITSNFVCIYIYIYNGREAMYATYVCVYNIFIMYRLILYD